MKNYCKHCGEKIIEGQKHDCPKFQFVKKFKQFINTILKRTGIESSMARRIESFERGQLVVPDSIAPNEGEIVVKQYDLAKLRSRFKGNFAEGRMQVTNKRLLFRAAGHSLIGKTTYQCEFAMDKIDGVDIRKDYRFMWFDLFKNLFITFYTNSLSLLLLFLPALLLKDFEEGGTGIGILSLLSLLLGLASCVPFFMLNKKFLLKSICLSAGVGLTMFTLAVAVVDTNILLIFLASIPVIFLLALYWISIFISCLAPNLSVEVKTSGGSPGIQIKHRYASFFIWNKMEENSGFSEILPGKDADLAISEIGALINDIKTLGDLGIEKWQSK